ncbi:MAG: BMP family ABC transporter substrate-binding protein [Chloroflexota bacterium]|nr:BMP family ABC transporter substrate-binding protein [Chloroflexota bacterium]
MRLYRTSDPMRDARMNRRSLTVGAGATAALAVTGRTAIAQDATPAGDPFRVAFVYIGPVGDLGYTYAHDQGRIALAETVPNVETAFLENVPDTLADSERAIRGYAEEGYDLIVATSFNYGPAVLSVAQQFPDIQFIHISGYQTAENVSTGFGKIEEPQYVSGYVAARMAETGTLGYVGAFPIPEVIRGINAFTLGAQSANPDVTVQVVWTNTWFDPQLEASAAQSLIDLGIEVIATNQDSPAPLQVAEAAGRFAVGYNVDTSELAPDAVLTSAIWDWGVYYIGAVEQILAGTWTTNQYWGSWADGVVDLAPLAAFVPEDVATEAEAMAEEFRTGAMGVTNIFTGPIAQQDGSEGVAEGASLTDEEILTMAWFVQGVEGSATG